MQSNIKRRFVSVYLNEIGDLQKAVNRLQLYKIIITAGKDLLLSDLDDTDYYQFDKACEVFEQLPTTNSLEMMRQNQQFVQLQDLVDSLNEDDLLYANEIKEPLNFLKSFAIRGKIDCNRLFEEFEKTRSRLFHVVTQEFINKQAAMPKELRRSEDMELKLPEKWELHQLGGSTSKFTSQISRRAFCMMDNDDRILNYHLLLNQSQTVCIMCELLTSNDQPANRNYKNSIYVLLYDTIEDKVITVTTKIRENRYVSEECLLRAGKYIISVQTGNCSDNTVGAITSNSMKLVDSDGKLTKHCKMTLMNMFDLFDFDENGRLSREEFDVYNTLASDEHVLDQEWDVLCRSFGANDGELPLQSFVALHQIEANNDPALANMWTTLMCVGYNEQLDLINNCPCTLTIFSESVVHVGQVELRRPTRRENQALVDYFWENGRQIASDVDVRIWKCEYFAVCIAGPMDLPYAMNLCRGHSKNVLIKEVMEFHRIPLKFVRPKIILHAIATGSDWSLTLSVDIAT